MHSHPVVSDVLGQRREDQLVLLCARTQADEGTGAKIQALASDEQLDWDRFYQLAKSHSVLQLVYRQLSATAASSVPNDQLARLKQHYETNAARNLLLAGELVRILRLLAHDGIDAVPYKGPALAVYAYDQLSLRRFVDLDILVRKTNVIRAKEILIAAGFACPTLWTNAQEDLLLRTQYNLVMTRDSGRLVVELHWEVASSLFASSLHAEAFWGRLETTRLLDAEVKTLSAEDLLLSLCVHGSKHMWERLAWICDVAEILKRRTELNWKVLRDLAASTGNQKMLSLGLSLAHSLLDAPLPEDVSAKLRADHAIASLANRVSRRLLQMGEGLPASVGESLKFNWAVRSGWQSKLRYCRLLFQPTDADIETLPLPRPLRFGYYLMRPFGLFRRVRERRVKQ